MGLSSWHWRRVPLRCWLQQAVARLRQLPEVSRHPEKEDALQNAFVKVFKKIEQGTSPAKFPSAKDLEAYLFKTYRNEFRDMIRRRRREILTGGEGMSSLMDTTETASQEVEQVDSNEFYNRVVRPRFHALIEQLDEPYRAVIKVTLKGLSPLEGAETLGITPNCFRVRLHRAKALLRELLADQDVPPEQWLLV